MRLGCVSPRHVTRAAAQGKLRCLGSNQHLKSKFGKGYVVQLKASDAAPRSSLLMIVVFAYRMIVPAH